jgi:hypothetical protein
MEGDGGGSELTSPIATPVNEFSDELFKGVPVGIREFMKTEKRLKEKHLQQDTRPG